MKRIINGKNVYKGYLYKGYEIRNHGYYPPDKAVWWEAVSLESGCADFHEHTKRAIKRAIDESFNNGETA